MIRCYHFHASRDIQKRKNGAQLAVVGKIPGTESNQIPLQVVTQPQVTDTLDVKKPTLQNCYRIVDTCTWFFFIKCNF